jgi:hypothetical protein
MDTMARQACTPSAARRPHSVVQTKGGPKTDARHISCVMATPAGTLNVEVVAIADRCRCLPACSCSLRARRQLVLDEEEVRDKEEVRGEEEVHGGGGS